jgi:hypothetical protein
MVSISRQADSVLIQPSLSAHIMYRSLRLLHERALDDTRAPCWASLPAHCRIISPQVKQH